jgi:ferredoxin-type protein NapG
MDICLLGDDRECSLCRSWCPYEAITYEFSEIEYTLVPKIDPKKCPGCGACEMVCPTSPTKAIVVYPL